MLNSNLKRTPELKVTDLTKEKVDNLKKLIRVAVDVDGYQGYEEDIKRFAEFFDGKLTVAEFHQRLESEYLKKSIMDLVSKP